MFETRSALCSWALLLAFSAPALAQMPGFGDLMTSGSPSNVDAAVPLDVDADGAIEILVAHQGAVSSLDDPDLYFDIVGDAVTRELIPASELVADLTTFRNAATPHAGQLITVGETGLLRWSYDAGAMTSTLLYPWTNGRQVDTFTTTSETLTFVSILDGDLVRTMFLFGGTPFPPMADTSFLGSPGDSFALVDYDGDTMPEIAAVTNYFGFANFLEIREIGGEFVDVINLNSAEAKIDVLPGTPDRIVLIDKHGSTSNWKLQVIGLGSIEAPLVFPNPLVELAVGYHDDDELPDVAVASTLGDHEVFQHQPSGATFSCELGLYPFGSDGVPIAILFADFDGDGDEEVAGFDDLDTLRLAEATPIDGDDFRFIVDDRLVDEAIEVPRGEYDFTLPDVAGATHVRVKLWKMTGEDGVVIAGTEQVELKDLSENPTVDLTIPVVYEHFEPHSIVFFLTELRLIQKQDDVTLHAFPAVLGLSDITFGFPDQPLIIDRFQPVGGGGVIGMGGGDGAQRGSWTPIPTEEDPLPPFPPGGGG